MKNYQILFLKLRTMSSKVLSGRQLILKNSLSTSLKPYSLTLKLRHNRLKFCALSKLSVGTCVTTKSFILKTVLRPC